VDKTFSENIFVSRKKTRKNNLDNEKVLCAKNERKKYKVSLENVIAK
jgi:hypothetical protein